MVTTNWWRFPLDAQWLFVGVMPLRAGWFVYAALDLGRCPGVSLPATCAMGFLASLCDPYGLECAISFVFVTDTD